jgi:hypothetical protein
VLLWDCSAVYFDGRDIWQHPCAVKVRLRQPS